jgi:uncharacterized protein (DUF4415 family)
MTAKRASNRRYTDADMAEVCDTPELTAEQIGKAKPFAEAFPALAETMRRGRGKQRAPTKQLVSLRLDRAVLDAFRATGDGWQSRMNEALRKAAPGSKLKRRG